MARNKYPEETVNRIVEVATRLFLEKGYEHTSVQDIIDNLGGLSKGAIYHHFRSKEDILIAVGDRITAESNRMLEKIIERRDLTGKEKLKAMFKEDINHQAETDMFKVAPDMGSNPKLFANMFQETIEVVAPQYIQPLIQEGIEDGSIRTDYPKQLAELIVLMTNVWINPMITSSSPEECYGKLKLFQQIMEGFGLDILDDEMLGRLQELTDIYRQNK